MHFGPSSSRLRHNDRGDGIDPKTVAKWKKRGFVSDLPTGPKAAAARRLPRGLTAQSACCAPQRAAQGPVEIRVKCPDDGSWIISPSSLQQALADEHVDFRFA
jgi:hypothetical protein